PTYPCVFFAIVFLCQFVEIAGSVYPDEYEEFISGISLVNFDISYVLSSSCFLSTNFYDRLAIVTVAPIVIISACAGSFLVAKRRNPSSDTAGSMVKHKHVSAALFIVFLVYSSVSFTVLQAFVCDSLDDGNSYLRADYSIVCNSEKHQTWLLYAGVMVFLYPVGIPAVFATWVVRHRRELE
ncbi:unnamed protein product, partial [Scytosiphon promiscuus]